MFSTSLSENLSPELPESYGRDYLVVLMCNPNKVFVFWESSVPGLSLALRRRPIDRNSSDELLILDNLTENHQMGRIYLEVASGNCLRLELGVWKEGNFDSHIISNTILLPECKGIRPELTDNNQIKLYFDYPLHNFKKV